MGKKANVEVVHEVNESQHRIVILKPDSTNDAGEWVEHRDVAWNGKYFAVTGNSPLPQGVFTCSVVKHQVLE
jgi:hypothetical protein